jgi:hypothetical protein
VSASRPENSAAAHDSRRAVDRQKEARAFAIIVYHALRRELADIESDDELDEKRARNMILRAVNLLPGYESRPNQEHSHLILIEKLDEGQDTVSLNVQDAVDSLLIVWRDFQKLAGRSEKQEP